FKGKDTFSKWACRRSYSSLGKPANSRFLPGTWMLRGLAMVRLLAAVGTGRCAAPEPGPRPPLVYCCKKKPAVMSETVQTPSVCQQTKVEWSAGRRTSPFTDHRYGSRQDRNRAATRPLPAPPGRCLRPTDAGGGAGRVVNHAE